MKNFLRCIFSLFLLLPFAGWAQCTPNTSLPGNDIVYPPAGSQVYSVNGREIVLLPRAYEGVPYDQTLYFKIPPDTTFGTFTATINYIRFLSIPNLPSGLSVSCTPADCTFPGGSYGCIQMAGTPLNADSLELEVVYEISISVAGGSTVVQQDTIEEIDIYLVTEGSVGIAQGSHREFSARFYPNPAGNTGYISFYAVDPDVHVKITNVIGNPVFNKNFSALPGQNKMALDIAGLSPGIYLYSVRNGRRIHSGRFIVSR